MNGTAVQVLKEMMAKMDALHVELHEENDVLILRLVVPSHISSGHTSTMRGWVIEGTITQLSISHSLITGTEMELSIRIQTP